MVRLDKAKRAKLTEQFRSYDKTGDFKLDFKEMKGLLKKGNPNFTDAELRKLFDQIDHNKDGTVNFDEFVDFIYGESKQQPTVAAPPELKTKFAEFSGQDDDMDNTQFKKMCKDCGLYDSNFTNMDSPNVFAQVKSRGQKVIEYEEFIKACNIIAQKKNCKTEEVYDAICGGELTYKGTRAMSTRLHDEESTHPGGGESREVRRMRLKEEDMAKVSGKEGDWSDVHKAFKGYDKTGNGLDCTEFGKLLLDCHLFDDVVFPRGAESITFQKVCNREKHLDFEMFKNAVRKIAQRKEIPIESLQDIIAQEGRRGPKMNTS